MNKLTDKRAILRTSLLLTVTYLVSYLTRINFGAVILEMVRSTGFEKASLSAAITGAFITYGAGQLVSGYCGDRLQPRTLILAGLLVSSLLNFLIPFCATPAKMTLLWCFNGFAQAFLWPPLVRLMASLFSGADYRRATVWVSWGSSFGTILLYLLSPLLISLDGWQLVFRFSAVCGVLMALVWLRSPIRISAEAGGAPAEKRSVAALLLTPMMLALMLAIVLVGALRDGVTTWMPTYIGETYQLGSSTAILTGVAMPLFGIACQQASSLVYKRYPSPPLTSFLISIVSIAAALLILLSTGGNAVLSVVGAAALTGSMYGVNMILIGMLPAYFRDTGNVSTISGVLNACVYIGSALSTYGFAQLSELAGWSATIVLWLCLAIACGALCLLCVPAWKRKFPQT